MAKIRTMNAQLKKLLVSINDIKTELRKGQEELAEKMNKGQEELAEKMNKGQEELADKKNKGQEELADKMNKNEGKMKGLTEEMNRSQERMEELKEEVNKSQEEMKKTLEEKFFKDYTRIQMKNRHQKSNETLQEFASEIERLANLAFIECPTNVREMLSLQYFVDGIKDPEVQRTVGMADVQD